MKYAEIANINVNDHVEKKQGLSYLSWAWAVDQMLRLDPTANWEYREPVRFGETMMVFCSVTLFGTTRTAQLPVMDHRNKAIANPDAFAVNTAMQRCLAKAIALHGLGLYLYTGEDVPSGEADDAKALVDRVITSSLSVLENNDASGMLEIWEELTEEEQMTVWKEFNSKQKAGIRELLQRARGERVTEA